MRGGAGLGLEVRWMKHGASVDVAVVGGAEWGGQCRAGAVLVL